MYIFYHFYLTDFFLIESVVSRSEQFSPYSVCRSVYIISKLIYFRQKSPIPPTNKVFLNNMMKQTMDGNARLIQGSGRNKVATKNHSAGRGDNPSYSHRNMSAGHKIKSYLYEKHLCKHKNSSNSELWSSSPPRNRRKHNMNTFSSKQQMEVQRYKQKSKPEQFHDDR